MPVLARSTSPDGAASCHVELDVDTLYLYLQSHHDGSRRGCWLRNLAPAPMEIERPRNGRASMMPLMDGEYEYARKLGPAVFDVLERAGHDCVYVGPRR